MVESSGSAMLDALERARPRFTDLLRSVEDPTRPAIGIWTIRDVAAHLATNWETYRDFLSGGGPRVDNIFDHPELMDQMAQAEPERDVRVLADRIDKSAIAWIEAARAMDSDERVSWYTGEAIPITVTTLASFQLGDFLLHGYDVAGAERRPWTIPKEEAALVLDGVLQMMPYYVDPEAAAGFSGRFDIRIRGGGRFILAFDDGAASVGPPDGGPADVHISADPTAMLLLGYNRIRPWGPALTGKIVSWGRKPLLGLKLPKLVRNI